MEMFKFTMADNSVAVIIVTSAPVYVISGAESEDEETPEYMFFLVLKKMKMRMNK